MFAIDLETTGRTAGYHEAIEIAIVPLDGSPSFHRFIRPEHPERAEAGALATHGIDLAGLKQTVTQEHVADWLQEWCESRGRLTLIAHNWPFEYSFLTAWLGSDRYDQLFHPHPRCTMQLALAINDQAKNAGKSPLFERFGLGYLSKYFGIRHDNAHSALFDAIAGAALYRELIRSDLMNLSSTDLPETENFVDNSPHGKKMAHN